MTELTIKEKWQVATIGKKSLLTKNRMSHEDLIKAKTSVVTEINSLDSSYDQILDTNINITENSTIEDFNVALDQLSSLFETILKSNVFNKDDLMSTFSTLVYDAIRDYILLFEVQEETPFEFLMSGNKEFEKAISPIISNFSFFFEEDFDEEIIEHFRFFGQLIKECQSPMEAGVKMQENAIARKYTMSGRTVLVFFFNFIEENR